MTTADLTPATIDRVADVMSGFGVEVNKAEHMEVAKANLNGLSVTFAILGSVLIVRAEADSGVETKTADATWYLAANQLNSTTAGARAVIVDAFESLVVRTERSLPVAAGVSDEQLATGLRHCVDQVITTHDELRTVAEQITEQLGAQAPDA